MRRSIHLLLSSCLVVSLLPTVSHAHPGRTAADGCHYCRTNCDSWGVPWNERHCHGGGGGGGGAAPTRTNTAPAQPRCPANADYIGGSCICRSGYAKYGSSCVKIPANAHAVENGTDAWECDEGYREVGNSCVKVEPEPVQEPKPVPTAEAGTPEPTPVVTQAVATQAAPVAASVTASSEDGSALGGFTLLALGGGAYWYIRKRRMKKMHSPSTKV